MDLSKPKDMKEALDHGLQDDQITKKAANSMKKTPKRISGLKKTKTGTPQVNHDEECEPPVLHS